MELACSRPGFLGVMGSFDSVFWALHVQGALLQAIRSFSGIPILKASTRWVGVTDGGALNLAFTGVERDVVPIDARLGMMFVGIAACFRLR